MPDARETRRTIEIAERVFLPDNRTPVLDVKVAPWLWICALRITSQTGNRYDGTGWLAGKRLVMTAGHCVFLRDISAWAAEIEVSFGLSGNTYVRRAISSDFVTPQDWIDTGRDEHDYGGILLDQDLGSELGYFATGSLNDDELRGLPCNISGYPADRYSASVLLTQQDRLQSLLPKRLVYDIDTYGGQSGSPIWSDVYGQHVAVGIHTWGDNNDNSGLRITDPVLQNIRDWKSR